MRERLEKFSALYLLILSLFGSDSFAQSARQEWRFYGGDAGGMRFSPLKQINRTNVTRLKRAWTYHTGELPKTMGSTITAFECTPIVIDGVLYLSTPTGRIIALDAETGSEMWKFDPHAGINVKRDVQAHRGVAYWEGQSSDGRKIDRRILFGTSDGRLIALDALTGKPCSDFGTGGTVNLREGFADKWPSASYAMSSPPAIYKNLVIAGARVPEYPSKGPSGDVRAFDVRTGQLVWHFHTVPRPGEFGHDTWQNGSWQERTGVNVWSIMSVDLERGMVFLPVGSPSYDFYGADRKGQNLFASSVVALKAETGQLVWHYQMVHHDLWDYDPPAEPSLITIRHNGRMIPVVAQVTKMGFIFVLNRLTDRKSVV